MVVQRRIHEKPVVLRRAEAVGDLSLGAATVAAIRRGKVTKGDPIAAAEIAGLLAMKQTAAIIPHCHAVALTGSRVEVRAAGRRVSVTAEAETLGRTGVEMEALLGATVALLTVWDMVKYLEKDERGLYPNVRLGPVRLRRKSKGSGGRR